ncbi:C39 family peptidase [Raoultibacter phocaeensis]|uniref:C39 family peptidase n=1 Tax=Raoultibacter phocaeensis TaxID=2479841 RepID=UPI00210211DA|nr:C39 family peptidase [Raoultibacter phocaeensis]
MERENRIQHPSIRNNYGTARSDAAARTQTQRRSSPRPATHVPNYTRRQPAYAAPHATRRRSQAPLPPTARVAHAHAEPRTAASALVALVLVAAVGFAAWFSFQASQGALPIADAAARNASGTVESTPKSEWAKGEMPYLYQTDPAWSSARYAENNFGESGCGPTCMAMVYAMLTGATDRDPAAMAKLAEQGGYSSPDGTAWLFMTEGAAALGLNATEVPADEQSMRRELAAGRPIIASMGPGDFTKTGHFIVICDIDLNSQLVIRDPNSPDRSAVSWDFDTILSQCRALWGYSLV